MQVQGRYGGKVGRYEITMAAMMPMVAGYGHDDGKPWGRATATARARARVRRPRGLKGEPSEGGPKGGK